LKRFFKKLSCVGIAAIMGVSTIGLSGCTVDWYSMYRGFHDNVTVPVVTTLCGWGFYLLWLAMGSPDDSPDPVSVELAEEKTKLSIDNEQNPAEIIYTDWYTHTEYYNEVFVVQYTSSIEEVIAASDYWLPLQTISEDFLEYAGEDFGYVFKEIGQEETTLRDIEGYWFYKYWTNTLYELNAENPDELFLKGIDVETFNFIQRRYYFAWYDIKTNRLYIGKHYS
jgi:hypothetical protein